MKKHRRRGIERLVAMLLAILMVTSGFSGVAAVSSEGEIDDVVVVPEIGEEAADEGEAVDELEPVLSSAGSSVVLDTRAATNIIDTSIVPETGAGEPLEIVQMDAGEQAGEQADEPEEIAAEAGDENESAEGVEADDAPTEEVAEEAEQTAETIETPKVSPTAATVIAPGSGSQLVVYVRSTGSDTNGGTSITDAVYSLSKAAELVDPNNGIIYVASTLVVRDEQVWQGLNLVREPGFTERLIYIETGADLTLENCIVDGDGITAEQPAIVVYGSGVLTAYGSTITDHDVYNEGVWGNSAAISALDGGTVFVKNSYITNNTVYSPDNTGTGVKYGGFGGGIFAGTSDLLMNYDPCSIIIENSFVQNNTANNGGGGICIFHGTSLTVTGSVISGNKATETDPAGDPASGGGIGIWGDSDVRITDSTIYDNYSDNAGGGICYGYDYDFGVDVLGTMRIERTTLRENTSGSGGGVYNMAELTMETVELSLNTAEAFVDDEGGGGLFSVGETAITGSNIEKNTAISRGGGISTWCALTVVDCTFKENVSGAHGGGSFNFSDEEDAEFRNTVFSGNRAAYSGGGQYTHSNSLLISNCTYTENHAQNSTTSPEDAGGGGLFVHRVYGEDGVYGADAIIRDSIFYKNTSVSSGGGILVNYSYAEIDNCTITENEGVWGAGVMMYMAGFTASIVNSYIAENVAGNGGGVYTYGEHGKVEIANTTITMNTTLLNEGTVTSYSRHGGGLISEFTDNGGVSLRNVEISHNTADAGGGIFLRRGALDGENVSIFENLARQAFGGNGTSGYAWIGGGGICVYPIQSTSSYACSLSLTSSTIIDNHADFIGTIGYNIYDGGIGGGVSLSGTNTSAYFSDVVISENAASHWGGGIASQYASITAENLTLADNTIAEHPDILPASSFATQFGAGICMSGGSLNMSDSLVSNNSAYADGGGIYLVSTANGEATDVEVAGTQFIDNTAVTGDGGAIYVEDGWINDTDVTVKIEDSTFTSNTALEGDGGAIYIWMLYPRLELDGVAFSLNRASTGYYWAVAGDCPSPYDTHAAAHDNYVDNTTYTVPFINAYNNYDVNFRSGFEPPEKSLDDDPEFSEGDYVEVGDTLTYTITQKNYMGGTADITIIDYIPDGTKLVDATELIHPDTTTYYMADGTSTTTTPANADYVQYVQWYFQNVNDGDTVTVELTVEVTDDALIEGQVENQATAEVGINKLDSNLVVNPLEIPGPDKDLDGTIQDGGTVAPGEQLDYVSPTRTTSPPPPRSSSGTRCRTAQSLKARTTPLPIRWSCTTATRTRAARTSPAPTRTRRM